MENTFDNQHTFSDLGIIPPILKALEDMGFALPTEVQSRAIPHILNKEDTIVMSKTGSGKTAVFGVSMLQLTDPQAECPQGLILTPTRELAVQVDTDIRHMAKYLPHKTTAIYGQHSMNAEIQALHDGVTIVTGTPGRVLDHIENGSLKTRNIRFLVLDEADRMLDMGFITQVERIIRSVPKDRVTMLFSATIPDEIKKICTRYMKNPATIEIESQTKTVDSIRQIYYRVNKDEKKAQLVRLLLAERPESCMIFCNTRIAVDQVRNYLNRQGYACQALHGEIPQAKRMKTIQQFKKGGFHILAATDVAARGIHIDELSLVINYDVPEDKDNYVHRIGRTGRVGHEGKAISLVTTDEIMSLYEIEEHIGTLIEEAELPTDDNLAAHKTEIEEWKKANEARTPGLNRTNRKKADNFGKSGKKPYRGKASGTCQSKASGLHNGKPDDNGKAHEQHSKSTVDKPGRRPARPVQPHTAECMQADTKKHYPSAAGQKPVRTDSTSPAANDQAGKPAPAGKSTAVQKPESNKGFLRRIIDKLLGR